MAIITTDQAPSSKPVSTVVGLSTSDTTLITVDSYVIPEVGFGLNTRSAPGVVEITSPLIVSNTGSTAETFTVTIVKNSFSYVLADEIVVEPNEVVFFPLNGQFLLSETGDQLKVKASSVGDLNAMISYTQGQAEENDPTPGIGIA